MLPKLSFMTGGAFMPEARELVDAVEAPMFEKPFDRAKVRRHIDELMGS